MKNENSISVEVENTDEVFRFRLCKGRKKTNWSSYTTFCYMDGYVAATEFYLNADNALKPILADTFCKLTGIC